MPEINRDHKYRCKVLDTIMTIWYKYPELRLGQLLVGAHLRAGSQSTDLFSVDDEKLLADLYKFDDIMSTRTVSGGTADTLGSEPSGPKGS